MVQTQAPAFAFLRTSVVKKELFIPVSQLYLTQMEILKDEFVCPLGKPWGQSSDSQVSGFFARQACLLTTPRA